MLWQRLTNRDLAIVRLENVAAKSRSYKLTILIGVTVPGRIQ